MVCAASLASATTLWLVLGAGRLVVAESAAANFASHLEPFGDAQTLGRLLGTAQNTSAQVGATPTWPEYTVPAEPGGPYLFQPESTWTSAFLPQALYALDKRYSVLCPNDRAGSNGTDWRALARTWSASLYNPNQAVLDSWLHDVGFNSVPMMAELEIDASNATARSALLSNAEALAKLYSPTVGCTLSWDRGPDNFEVVRLACWSAKALRLRSFCPATDHRQHDEPATLARCGRLDRQRDLPSHG